MWNSRALSRLHAGNFWAHSCFRANRFNKLCRTWLKRYWLLRKRQSMRDRKGIGGRQRSLSLSSVSFLSCPLRCPHLIGEIFNLNIFRRKRKPEYLEKNLSRQHLRTKNKLKRHMVLTHTTSVGGECSHHHATLTPLPSPPLPPIKARLNFIKEVWRSYSFLLFWLWTKLERKKKRLKRGRGHWSQMCLIRNLPAVARYKPPRNQNPPTF